MLVNLLVVIPLISLINAVPNSIFPTSTCEDDATYCQVNDTATCGPIFQDYYDKCISIVLNQPYNKTYCPDGCEGSLDSYLSYVYPNYTRDGNPCNCLNNSPGCVNGTRILRNLRCLATSCSLRAEMCNMDTDCAPLLANLTSLCQDVLVNNITSSCPFGCRQAMIDYVNYFGGGYNAIDFCQCGPGPDPVCRSNKILLEQAGCAVRDCQAQFEKCMDNNPMGCKPIAENYFDKCQIVFNGTWQENYCPRECKMAAKAYTGFFESRSNSNSDFFCSCYTPECIAGQRKLFDVGCFAENCVTAADRCSMKPACNTKLQTYIDECQAVLNGTWTRNYCPRKCKMAFDEFVVMAFPQFNATNPTAYCDCYSDGNCIEGKDRLLAARCLVEDCDSFVDQCERDPMCKPDFDNYVDNCQIVLNGTWNQDFCPRECAYSFSSFISAAAPDIENNYTTPNDLCVCTNPDCMNGAQTLIDGGCFQLSCPRVFAECEADPGCQPYAMNFTDSCSTVIDGSTMICPDACKEAISDYVEAATGRAVSQNYCTCLGNPECEADGLKLVNAGCIPRDSCENTYNLCLLDTTCAPVAMTYASSCADYLDGSTADTICDPTCKVALKDYVETIYTGDVCVADSIPTPICSCSNVGCTTVRSILYNLGCLDYGNDTNICPNGTITPPSPTAAPTKAPLAVGSPTQAPINGTLPDNNVSIASKPFIYFTIFCVLFSIYWM